MDGRTQRRFAGPGFATLACLGLMQETWCAQGAGTGSQRQLRGTSDALVSLLAREPSKGFAVVSATNASRCVYLTEAPRKLLRPRIGPCSTGKTQPTKFLLPGDSSGLIKVAEDPSLCLDSPGHGLLQLWSCDDVQKAKRMDFTFHSEPPGWIGVPHFDLPDRADAENMDASDLKAVTRRVEDLGYAGFSVFKGRAWLKKINHMTVKDLDYMGTGDPCVFYLHRNESGDISIRLTSQPDICMLAPTELGESEVATAPCYGEGTKSAGERAWTAGMVFRVQEDVEPSTGYATTTLEITPKPALRPTTKPAEDTGNMSRLIIVLNVENVDYPKLGANLPLETKFKNVIQEDIATMAGLGRDNVAVRLEPGSVRAINTLSVPETNNSEDMRSKLQFDRLDEKVASHIRSIEGIGDVSYGEITVRSSEMTNQDTRRSLPYAIFLSVFLVLAALVIIGVVVIRRNKTRNVAIAPEALVPDKTKELQENSDPLLEGADDGPADNGDFPKSSESDGLLGEPNGNEESAVPTEEHGEKQEEEKQEEEQQEEEKQLEEKEEEEKEAEKKQEEEKQEEVAGNGQAKEEEAPDGQPLAAAVAPADDEDPELKAALAASLQDLAADTQDGNADLINPFAADTVDKAEVPDAGLSGC